MAMKKIFNMDTATRTTECGSVGCIGGWMGTMMGLGVEDACDFVLGYMNRGRFKELFFPPTPKDKHGEPVEDYYDKITAAHAVKAIDNFTKTGKPKWETILK
jgi:hypothetical protein